MHRPRRTRPRDICYSFAEGRSLRRCSIQYGSRSRAALSLIAEQIVAGSGTGATAALSASAAGPFAYRTGPSTSQHHFVWFDRSGAALETIPGSDLGDGYNSSLSPDASRLATSSRVEGTADVWLLDVKRGVSTRLTTDPAFDLGPVWSPDGHRIVFTSNRKRAVRVRALHEVRRWHGKRRAAGREGAGAQRLVTGRTIHPLYDRGLEG